MLRILMIVPEDIIDISREVASSHRYNDIHIQVEQASMNTGYEIAKEYEKRGFNAIIARGGTHILLKNSDISIPVVPIPIHVIDVFEAIEKALIIDDSIAILAFNNMVVPSESLMRISGVNYKLISINHEEEVETVLRDLSFSGTKVIIGGGVISKFTSKYGMHPVVMRSSKESILSAIEESRRVAKATLEEKKRLLRLRAIVENSNDGIMLVNKNGTIKILNTAAEKLLCLNSTELIGKSISEVLPELEVKDSSDKENFYTEVIKEINNTNLLITNIPVEVNDEIEDVITLLQDVNRIQAMEEKIRREIITTGFYAKYTFDDVVGRSSVSKEVIRIAKEYALVNSTILIEGETGTGKEVIAQSIHNYSRVSNGPFVAINCAAFPENLLESELFGYAPGSFTGADRKGKRGLFELAHGGTIFLDEICEMNPLLQGRLLRVLQEKHVMRIGDSKLIPIEVRVIAASNKNLMDLVMQRKFRDDLFYRINVLKINMPPLREKVEDIPELVHKFIKEYSIKLKKPTLSFNDEAMNYIMCYKWPGNVRELKNFVERLMVLSKKNRLQLEDIRGKYFFFDESISCIRTDDGSFSDLNNSLCKNDDEKERIKKILMENNGLMNYTAQSLGISRTTLWRKIKKYDIDI